MSTLCFARFPPKSHHFMDTRKRNYIPSLNPIVTVLFELWCFCIDKPMISAILTYTSILYNKKLTYSLRKEICGEYACEKSLKCLRWCHFYMRQCDQNTTWLLFGKYLRFSKRNIFQAQHGKRSQRMSKVNG